MFTIFQKITAYLWYGNDDDNGDEGEDNRYDESDDVKENGTKTVVGKISHVYSGHGLIDGEIYFSFDCVLGGLRPSTGELVTVVARQEYEGGGWQAVQVTGFSEYWDLTSCNENRSALSDALWSGSSVDPEPASKNESMVSEAVHVDTGPRMESIIGKISQVSAEGHGFINDSIPFTCEDCSAAYYPCDGDWVKTDVAINGDACNSNPDSHAINILPLRTLEFQGVITAVREDHGYVDAGASTSIFFNAGAYLAGYVPQRRDCVKGTAVESVQGQCSWRALLVSPVFNPFPSNRIINPTSGEPVDVRYLDNLCKNKYGIHMSDDVDFGICHPGNKKTMTVWVRNNGVHPQVFVGCEVWGQSLLFSVESVKLMLELANGTGGTKKTNPDISANQRAVLLPAMALYVNIACEPRYVGMEHQILVVQFEGYCIGRRLSVKVKDPYQVHVMPSSSFEFKQKDAYNRTRPGQNTGWVVPGQRPINRFKNRTHLPHRLPQFQVPDELREFVAEKKDLAEVCPALGQASCLSQYTQRFQSLLHLEEIQMDEDIQEFDLTRVPLRPFGAFLALRVPGLAEGRPSVLIGDRVILSQPGEKGGLQYEGYVHEVLSEEVLLKFHNSFHQSHHGEDYDVQFTFNRSTLRRCHQAVELALQLGEDVVFPEKLNPKLPQWTPKYDNRKRRKVPTVGEHVNANGVTPNYGKREEERLKYFNEKLNSRQKEAVIRILLGQGRPMPYILFGPPGTGKTVTVVEAILQIFTNCSSSRIMACTPSNSAADLLTERLQQSGVLSTSDLVRVNALQRVEESIPQCIRPYCYDGENLGQVSRYRIIVCTCSSAGMLFSLGIKTGHFTHVFVDEAGQATEPECFIPLSLIAGADGQIILAGDPLQLGPVLASKLAKQYGLDLSYLERLTQLPLYRRDVTKYGDQGGYNPLLVTKLLENYRSHEVLLNLSSKLFYNDELLVKAVPGLTDSLCQWSELPTPGFPLIFHGVRGEDLREGNSPSWFNPMETVQVVRYLQALFTSDTHSVAPDDVGVITPYRKQVEKIRLLIDKLGIPAVKVGSVEEFQGQERQVIIISTVRSTEDIVSFDVRHNVGFLSNPKRFNVAITRAQALLVVIGNPFVLAQDPQWSSLLQYCSKHGAYTGCDIPNLDDYRYSHMEMPPALNAIIQLIKSNEVGGWFSPCAPSSLTFLLNMVVLARVLS